MTCRLRAIFVRGDQHSNVQIMNVSITWTLMSAVRERLIHYLSSIVTAIAVEDLPTPGTRASAAMPLTLFHKNLQFPASRKLTNDGCNYKINSCTLTLMLYDI